MFNSMRPRDGRRPLVLIIETKRLAQNKNICQGDWAPAAGNRPLAYFQKKSPSRTSDSENRLGSIFTSFECANTVGCSVNG